MESKWRYHPHYHHLGYRYDIYLYFLLIEDKTDYQLEGKSQNKEIFCLLMAISSDRVLKQTLR